MHGFSPGQSDRADALFTKCMMAFGALETGGRLQVVQTGRSPVPQERLNPELRNADFRNRDTSRHLFQVGFQNQSDGAELQSLAGLEEAFLNELAVDACS